MVIFLAGLRQIPGMYYEAASVDGATRWTKFTKITLPLLSPIIFFNLVLQLINAFQSFTQAYVVSGGTGGPADSTLFYSLYLYQQGLRAVPDGLRRSDGVAAGGHRRCADRGQLLPLEVLGVLR